MSFIDIIIILLLAYGGISGYMRGLVKQLGSIIALIIAIPVCIYYGDFATNYLISVVPSATEWVAPDYTTKIVAYSALFILVVLVISIISSFFKSIINTIHLGVFDSILGSIFKIFKLFLILSIGLNIWFAVKPESSIFKTQHMMQNKPFKITFELAPKIFGTKLMNDNISAIVNKKEEKQ